MLVVDGVLELAVRVAHVGRRDLAIEQQEDTRPRNGLLVVPCTGSFKSMAHEDRARLYRSESTDVRHLHGDHRETAVRRHSQRDADASAEAPLVGHPMRRR